LTFAQSDTTLRKVNFPLRVDHLKNRLEEIRKQKNIKQEELAEALEVSRQTIGSIENGRYNPSIILAFKIANYFNLNIPDIFIYEERPKNEEK
jgi:putative transcriptional regulator